MSIESMKKSIGRSLENYGTAVTLSIREDGAIDFATGKPVQTITNSDIIAVVGRFTANEIRDGIVNIDDLKCTLVHPDKVKIGDKVIAGTETYSVLNVRLLIRGGVLLKQTLQLRK
ncbi:MAG: hypothetical protein DRG09_06920 [Epsilonproteobacteria bacterium]|nr:MAG: hypothetical protein DRG09_06920 [Campylobacterota bacterium]